MEPNTPTSLYRRLGGYDVIAAVIDELFVQLRADPQFSRFATGRGNDSQARARQLIVEQMCSLTGGPCVYIGRDMKSSHAGLGITESDWQANMKYTGIALDKNNVKPRERAEFLAIFERYKTDIVEVR